MLTMISSMDEVTHITTSLALWKILSKLIHLPFSKTNTFQKSKTSSVQCFGCFPSK